MMKAGEPVISCAVASPGEKMLNLQVLQIDVKRI